MRLRTIGAAVALVAAGAVVASGATYYVSPQGDDAANGHSPQHPWHTCKKVLASTFEAGDTILFQRGGEWRERLQASSNGAAGRPVTYDAYGKGAKPKFWGSDVLENAKFKPAGNGQYAYVLPGRADSALRDHVFVPSTWAGDTLTVTSDTDPRTDGKVYTACTRGNVMFSDRKSHLAFRNLVVDETAGQITEGPNQGYGVRIEGSTDVLVESCEAYRCGRHHFAAINSTAFVGRHLVAAYVQPNTPGDNTPYVSYADTGAPVAHCTTTWDDIVARHMEDGHGGRSNMFVSHGDQVGLITMVNSTATEKVSFLSAPVVVRHMTVRENGSIENFGAGVLIDGVRLLDSAAVDQYGSNGTIQNCVATLTPTGGGPTGYGAAIVVRDKAKGNVVRFNTLVTRSFSGLCLAGGESATRWYGNVFDATGAAVAKPSGPLTAADVPRADGNFYATGATIGGQSVDAFRSSGLGPHSLSGDPKFVDPAKGDCRLRAGSPCIRALTVRPGEVPPTDASGKPRSKVPPVDFGAFAFVKP